MFKDIAATWDLAWAPTLGVLPDDLETPKEGLGDTSVDSSSPNDDDDVHEDETPNLTQPPNPTQKKGKKLVLPSSHRAKGRKEERHYSWHNNLVVSVMLWSYGT